MDKLLYPVPEACQQLGISRSALYDLMARGEIHPLKVGARTLFPAAELEGARPARRQHRRDGVSDERS
jgi:excisionase family DNA binding protein